MGGIYPVSLKIKAIKRVECGEGVLAVSRDIGVTRKAPHDCIRAWNAMSVKGLDRKRGRKPGRLKFRAVAMTGIGSGALVVARVRIVELELMIGRQQMELDFFHQALRTLEKKSPQGKAVTPSLKRSKPMCSGYADWLLCLGPASKGIARKAILK
jgi:transposase